MVYPGSQQPVISYEIFRFFFNLLTYRLLDSDKIFVFYSLQNAVETKVQIFINVEQGGVVFCKFTLLRNPLKQSSFVIERRMYFSPL